MTADAGALVRQYYDALDAHEYERLAAVLAPDFVQRRPDRTFDDRDAFVRFMHEDRPNPTTRHEILDLVADDDRAAVRGRVADATADRSLFEFADFFEIEDDRIVRLETYSR